MGNEQPSEHDRDALQQAMEHLVSELVEAGWPRMPALVFTALLTSDEGKLTSSELTRMLEVSPAAVSGAVRYLTDQGLLTRERLPGSRREVYRVRNNVWHEVIARGQRTLLRTEEALGATRDVLGADSPAGSRTGEMLDFYRFYRQELSRLLETWDRRRTELTRSTLGGDAEARAGAGGRGRGRPE